jgi:hypothetical protein
MQCGFVTLCSSLLLKTQEVLMIDLVQSNIAYSSLVYTLTMAYFEYYPFFTPLQPPTNRS